MKNKEITHKDYAEVVSHRLCVTINVAEKALKSLDSIPVKAFTKLANMGDIQALEYVLNLGEK